MHHDAVGGNWKRAYDYSQPGDPLGPQINNRLRATSATGDTIGVPETYSHPYQYDDHGNMTAMPHIDVLTWDEDDRLQSTDRSSASEGITYYVYDGSGQRVRKVHVKNSTRKQRLYFGAWELYRDEHNISTTPVLDIERETLHVHDDTGRICLIETKTAEDNAPIVAPANVARYQYSNHLGTAALELDDAAEVISYEEFHPYGTSSYAAANSAVEVSAKRYRYTGKERDEETGLAYQGARYYAPWLARWSSADPSGLSDGPNVYSYVSGNPLRYSDPSGKNKRPTADEMYRAALGLPNTSRDLLAVPDDGRDRFQESVEHHQRGQAAIDSLSTTAIKSSQRSGARIQAVGGAIGMVVGVATGNVALAAYSADQFQAGVRSIAQDAPVETFAHQGLRGGAEAAGFSEETAANIASGVELVGSFALGVRSQYKAEVAAWRRAGNGASAVAVNGNADEAIVGEVASAPSSSGIKALPPAKAATADGPALIDTDTLILAQKGGAPQLAAIRASSRTIASGNAREFIRGTVQQRAARREFLEREGITIMSPGEARMLRQTPEFKEVVSAVTGRGHSTTDAELVGFARASGRTVITSEKRLTNVLNNNLGDLGVKVYKAR